MNYLWLLTLILVIGKMLNYIHWSWWIVFAPALVSTAIGLTILGLVLAAAILAVFTGK